MKPKAIDAGQNEEGQNSRIIAHSSSEVASDADQEGEVVGDEIDVAIQQCLEDQTSLKKLKISKVSKGQYLLESKEYTMKLLQGNNLAIRMHAGYIYADCLVHFEEELYKIVK